jgi:hypothetical protein
MRPHRRVNKRQGSKVGIDDAKLRQGGTKSRRIYRARARLLDWRMRRRGVVFAIGSSFASTLSIQPSKPSQRQSARVTGAIVPTPLRPQFRRRSPADSRRRKQPSENTKAAEVAAGESFHLAGPTGSNPRPPA